MAAVVEAADCTPSSKGYFELDNLEQPDIVQVEWDTAYLLLRQ